MNYKQFSLFCLCLIFFNHVYASKGSTVEVQINEDGFSFFGGSFYRGQTIRFINSGTQTHRIQDKSSMIDSGMLHPGQSFDLIIPTSTQIPSDPHRLELFDNQGQDNSFKTSIFKELDPILLFPSVTWVLRDQDLDILVLFGVDFTTFAPVYIPPNQQKNIEIKLDGVIYFSGVWTAFKELSYVKMEDNIPTPFGQGSVTGSRGYRTHIITIPANYLSVGLHVLTMTVTMLDNSVHIEEGRYIVVETSCTLVNPSCL